MVKTSTPVKENDLDLTVRQELKMLHEVKADLDMVRMKLGGRTRFTDLANSINDAIMKAQTELIAADDYLNERS
jgi:hypothetical protein